MDWGRLIMLTATEDDACVYKGRVLLFLLSVD